MKKYGRDNRPYIKPVIRIQLPEDHFKFRLFLIAVLMIIAVIALAVGYSAALETEPGWQMVTAAGNQASCADDFIFMYEFTESTQASTALNTRLTRLYGELTLEAYRIFSPDLLEEGLHNLAYLNANPNKAVSLEQPLYDALALMAQSNLRHLYLAPAYSQYGSLFLCDNDLDAAAMDPTRDPDTQAWLKSLSAFVSDAHHIRLEMLTPPQVKLHVSDAYLRFAEESGITALADFGWMRNAFIADYLAQSLTDQGYTRGHLTSFDGFTRNLDTRGNTFYFNLFNRQGNDIFMPGRMTYEGPAAIVYLRDYPMSNADRWHYYSYASGEIVSILLDPKDCLPKAATENLVFFSSTAGCAEILLKTVSLYIADSLNPQELDPLRQSGIYSIWFENGTPKHNSPSLTLEAVTE